MSTTVFLAAEYSKDSRMGITLFIILFAVPAVAVIIFKLSATASAHALIEKANILSDSGELVAARKKYNRAAVRFRLTDHMLEAARDLRRRQYVTGAMVLYHHAAQRGVLDSAKLHNASIANLELAELYLSQNDRDSARPLLDKAASMFNAPRAVRDSALAALARLEAGQQTGSGS